MQAASSHVEEPTDRERRSTGYRRDAARSDLFGNSPCLGQRQSASIRGHGAFGFLPPHHPFRLTRPTKRGMEYCRRRQCEMHDGWITCAPLKAFSSVRTDRWGNIRSHRRREKRQHLRVPRSHHPLATRSSCSHKSISRRSLSCARAVHLRPLSRINHSICHDCPLCGRQCARLVPPTSKRETEASTSTCHVAAASAWGLGSGSSYRRLSCQ